MAFTVSMVPVIPYGIKKLQYESNLARRALPAHSRKAENLLMPKLSRSRESLGMSRFSALQVVARRGQHLLTVWTFTRY